MHRVARSGAIVKSPFHNPPLHKLSNAVARPRRAANPHKIKPKSMTLISLIDTGRPTSVSGMIESFSFDNTVVLTRSSRLVERERREETVSNELPKAVMAATDDILS